MEPYRQRQTELMDVFFGAVGWCYHCELRTRCLLNFTVDCQDEESSQTLCMVAEDGFGIGKT